MFGLAGIASGGAGGGGGGLQMSSAATSSLSDRSPINIAPIACNLGAMFLPYSQGGPENGGIGADFMARYSGGGISPGTAIAKGTNWTMLAIIGGVGIVALIALGKFL